MARKLPDFIVTDGLKIRERNYELIEKRANYGFSVKWDVKDYVVALSSSQVESMDKALTRFVSVIQKNLTGKRSGNIYRVKIPGNRKWIRHVAADTNEYPAVMTGRLVNSISFADSITKKTTKPNSSIGYKGAFKKDFIKAPSRERGKIVYVVGTNVPYAKDLEFKSSRDGGRPFMRRSFNSSFNKVLISVIDGINV